jgi:HAD superfamily hydrolase (TIGR01509 family)
MAPPFTLLFDLDGTLVDTDHLHLGAYQELLARFGRSLDLQGYRAHIMGAANSAIAERYFPELDGAARAGISAEKEALFRARLATLTPTRGLLRLLDHAEAERWAMAVITNAPRENADAMLGGLGLGGRFAHVVIGEELAHGKPHPLPYLTGLALTGGVAGRALAFEDSRSGVQAAVAAGIETVGMLTGLDEAALRREGAHHVIADFEDSALWALLAARAGLTKGESL